MLYGWSTSVHLMVAGARSGSAEKIEFRVVGSLVRGTLYTPSTAGGPLPAVVMAHGWGLVSGGDLEDYASAFVGAGFAALTFDFRHLGASEGEPKQDMDPYRQTLARSPTTTCQPKARSARTGETKLPSNRSSSPGHMSPEPTSSGSPPLPCS